MNEVIFIRCSFAYSPFDSLPIRDGVVDWDCVESVAVADLMAALDHVRQHGALPVGICSHIFEPFIE